VLSFLTGSGTVEGITTANDGMAKMISASASKDNLEKAWKL
jgi:hypothetical protein